MRARVGLVALAAVVAVVAASCDMNGGSGQSASEIGFQQGPVQYLRDVRLPLSKAPSSVQRAFAARRYSAAAPREAGRVHGPRGSVVLWASPAYGGGWCEGLQQPRLRFNRMSVSCIWPRSWMGHRLDITGYLPRLYWGRVPQRSARTMHLRLNDGRSLNVPIRSGFFVVQVPDRVLAHTAPSALVAEDAQGRPVAAEKGLFSPMAISPPAFGGIQRPPGGAELARKHELVAHATVAGRASIWAAPSFAAPARCTWLQIGRAVFGGGCRRYQPPRRGLSEVVPLRLQVQGTSLNLLWGQVGEDVAQLDLLFQDGSRLKLAHRGGVFLYPLPQSRWRHGHRPAFLVARADSGRLLGKQLLYEYTLASD